MPILSEVWLTNFELKIEQEFCCYLYKIFMNFRKYQSTRQLGWSIISYFTMEHYLRTISQLFNHGDKIGALWAKYAYFFRKLQSATLLLGHGKDDFEGTAARSGEGRSLNAAVPPRCGAPIEAPSHFSPSKTSSGVWSFEGERLRAVNILCYQTLYMKKKESK